MKYNLWILGQDIPEMKTIESLLLACRQHVARIKSSRSSEIEYLTTPGPCWSMANNICVGIGLTYVRCVVLSPPPSLLDQVIVRVIGERLKEAYVLSEDGGILEDLSEMTVWRALTAIQNSAPGAQLWVDTQGCGAHTLLRSNPLQ